MLTNISWFDDPDVWEAAREQLAQLLNGPSLSPTPTPNTTAIVNPTGTPNLTATVEPTSTPGNTLTAAVTFTPTPTMTPMASITPTPTPTIPLPEVFWGKPALAYPNPTSESMTFLVEVPQAGDVKVIICNIAGEVVTVLNDHLNQGTHPMRWDCHQVRPGIYLACIVQNNHQLAKLKVAIR